MRNPDYEHIYPDYKDEELLPLPDRQSLNAEERASFDWVMGKLQAMHDSIPTLRDRGQKARIPPLCTALLQSPLVAERWIGFSGFFQGMEARGSFGNRERELVEQALNPLVGEFGRLHIADAVGNGISPHDVKAIWENRLDDLAPEDRQLVEYVQATWKGELSRELFQALAARMGVKTAVEFTALITFKVGLMITVRAMWNIQGQKSDQEGGHEALQRFIDGEYKALEYGRTTQVWVDEKASGAICRQTTAPADGVAPKLKTSDYLMLQGPAGEKLLKSPSRVPTPERAAQMLEIDLNYARCYLERDYDGLLGHLVDTPEYEWYPQAIRMTGKEAALARCKIGYNNTIKQIDPSKNDDTREYRAIAFGENIMVGETTATFVLPDGTRKRCSYVAIIEFDGDKMVGERVYSDRYHASLREASLTDEFFAVRGVERL